MATFVLVHGGFHGGWCWRRVAHRLRNQGHDVYTPTLTGMGERSHLLSRSIDLETHIADVIGVLEWEDLSEVVLVGHSYAGMVIAGVADRLPERIARLVYLDALLPQDGESSFDVLGTSAADRFTAQQSDPVKFDMVLPPAETAKYLGVSDPDDLAWEASKLTLMPLPACTQPLKLKGVGMGVPTLFVSCTLTKHDFMERTLARADARAAQDPSFHVANLAATHMAMVTHPAETAEVLVGSLG